MQPHLVHVLSLLIYVCRCLPVFIFFLLHIIKYSIASELQQSVATMIILFAGLYAILSPNFQY